MKLSFLGFLSLFTIIEHIKCACPTDAKLWLYLYQTPSSPYCTQYSGSTCTCCGYSSDNLYVYGSDCTVGTSDDVISGEKITKRCDSNCASGGCLNGLCQKCKVFDSNKTFALLTTSDTRNASCVSSCEHYQGLFTQNRTQGYFCTSCPSLCTVCNSTSGCRECKYNLVRALDADISSLTTKIQGGSLNCSKHTYRQNLTEASSGYYQQIYITPKDLNCRATQQCNGSLQNPFDDINLVFQYLVDTVKIGQKSKLKVDINFLKDQANTNHFWLENSTLPVHYKRIFERTLVDATLQPASCSDTTKCFGAQEKPKIFVKSNFITLFTTWKLKIINLIFDGSELIPDGTCYQTYKNSRTRCCDSSGSELPFPASSTSGAICNPGMAYGTLLHPFLNYDPSTEVWPSGPYSFITVQMLYDASTQIVVPELTIQGCEFNHFWYHRYARSLISLNNYASNLTITNVSFNNFYFSHGLISNVHNSLQRDTLFTDNVVSNYNCLNLNSSLKECFAIKIQGSNFSSSLYGDYLFSTKANQLISSQTLATAVLPKNEGIVLFLNSFNGNIIIRDSTFQKLASLMFSSGSKPTTCMSPRRVVISRLFHSMERLIQAELGHEKFKNTQSSSIINIRNLLKGITIYNNIFNNNLALTGTNFLIHNFQNAQSYPIIIEKNFFRQNLAVLFGSSFAIVNYARDYVAMQCKGIYMNNNTFEQNIQCPQAAGNAIIACIPEKQNLSPIFTKQPIKNQVLESTTWNTYYPSVNQANNTATVQENYNTATQVVFSWFIVKAMSEYSTASLITHPITLQKVVDITRITILSNKFNQNYASLAQLYIHGAAYSKIYYNTLSNNAFPWTVLFPPSLTSIPIFAKVLSSQESGYFVSSPLMLRLSTYVSIRYNAFSNNQQVATSSPALTVGSAISIDRYLGAISVSLIYNDFINHIGLNSAQIKSLDAYTRSQTASSVLQTLENGGAQPLITFSLWENFAGVYYVPGTDFTPQVDTRNRISVNQGMKGIWPGFSIQGSYFEGNVFNTGKTNQLYLSGTGAVVWFFKDTDRESGSFFLAKYPNGQLARDASFTIYLTTFLYNQVLDDRCLIHSSNFEVTSIENTTFYANLVLNRSENNKNALIGLAPFGNSPPSGEVSNSTWVSNFGRLLYFEGVQNRSYQGYYYYFQTNIILTHISPDSVLYAQYAKGLQIVSTTAQNITARTTFLDLEVVYIITIQTLSITNITTSLGGCMRVDNFTSSLTMTNFKCRNSHLIVPAVLKDSERGPLSACLSLKSRNPSLESSGALMSFTTLVCDSPVISYENENYLQPGLTKSHCFVVSEVGKFIFYYMNCTGASYQLGLQDKNLQLGTVSLSTSLYFYGSNFQQNNAYAPVVMSGSYVILVLCNVIANTAQTLATFLFAQNTNIKNPELYITNSVFRANRCENCGSLVSAITTPLLIQDSNFTDNYSNGPVLDSKLGNWIEVDKCIFARNKASSQIAVINSLGSQLFCFNSTFDQNEALGQLIVVYNAYSGFQDCNFSNFKSSISGGSYLKLIGGQVEIFQSHFVENSSDISNKQGGFLQIMGSNYYAKIRNCSFENGSAQKGGAIYFDGSFDGAYNGSFDGSFGYGYNGSAGRSWIQVGYSTFKGNKAKYGGAIYITRGDINMSSCQFEDNYAERGGSLYSNFTQVVISEANFNTMLGNTMYAENSNLNMGYVNFQANERAVGPTSAIYAYNATFIMIDANISGFNSQGSDSSRITSPVSIIKSAPDALATLISKVTFENNTGGMGGALQVIENHNVWLFYCVFRNNTAKEGGAVFYQTSDPGLIYFVLNIFNQNTATVTGGAIQLAGKGSNFSLWGEDTDDPYSGFTGNIAPYGQNIGSYGLHLVQVPFNQSLFNLYRQERIETRLLQQEDDNNNNMTISEYRNGKTIYPPLMYVLLDNYNQIVTNDNSSRVTVTGSKTAGSNVLKPVESDSFYTAFMGYFIVDSVTPYFGPKSGVIINVSLNQTRALEYYSVSDDEYQMIHAGVNFTILPKNCSLGEILTVYDTCSLCQTGEYTLTEGSTDSCTKCPIEGICAGSFIYGPRSSYWRFSSQDNRLSRCLNDEACLGALLTDNSLKEKSHCPENQLYNESFCFVGWCREGYKGNLCAECQEGWGIDNTMLGTCAKCNDNPRYYIKQGLLALVSAIYILYMVRSALKKEKIRPTSPLQLKTVNYTEHNNNQITYPISSISDMLKEEDSVSQRNRQKEIVLPKISSIEMTKIDLNDSPPARKPSPSLLQDNLGSPARWQSPRKMEALRTPDQDPYRNFGDMMSVARSETEDIEENSLRDYFIDMGMSGEYKKKDVKRSTTDLEMIKINADDAPYASVLTPKSIEEEEENQGIKPGKIKIVSTSALEREVYRNKGDDISVIREEEEEGEEIMSDGGIQMKTRIAETEHNLLSSLPSPKAITDTEPNLLSGLSSPKESADTPLTLDRKIRTDINQIRRFQTQTQDLRSFASLPLRRNGKSALDKVQEVKIDTLTKVNNDNQETAQNFTATAKIYLKILTSYIHAMAIFGALGTNWTEEYNTYFQAHSAVPQVSADIFFFDCLIKRSFLSDLGFRPFSIKLMLVSVSPLIFSVLIIVLWTIFFILRYRTRFNKFTHKLATNIIVSLMVVYFIIYPVILLTNLQAFGCRVLGDNNNSTYLGVDPQMKCWESEHLQIALQIALPSLIIWGILIPLIGFLLLFRTCLDNQVVKERLGFLYQGYKPSYYYWEFVIVCRKLTLVLAIISSNVLNMDLTATIVLGINALFYLLQIKVDPYDSNESNQLERSSLILSTITSYCGMYFLADPLPLAIKIIILVLLTSANVIFYLHWTTEFLKVKSRELLSSHVTIMYWQRVLLEFLANFEWRKRGVLQRKNEGVRASKSI